LSYGHHVQSRSYQATFAIAGAVAWVAGLGHTASILERPFNRVGGSVMAVRETVAFDLERIDRLIEEEEARLEPKHRASLEYRTTAERYVAGGVASSWQDSPPHAIFIERGQGNRLYDIDGNE